MTDNREAYARLGAAFEMCLPEHKASLHITHNVHRDNYQTIEEYYEDDDSWLDGEKEKAIAADSVWELQWYPETPIGFYRFRAASLEALMRHVAGLRMIAGGLYG